MSLVQQRDWDEKWILKCTAVLVICVSAVALVDARSRTQSLYTTSTPVVQSTSTGVLQGTRYVSRSQVLQEALQAYDDELALLNAAESASASTSLPSAGLAALCTSFFLAAAGISLKVLNYMQPKPAGSVRAIDVLQLDTISMAAAAAEKKNKKAAKDKKGGKGKEPKAERVPIVLTPREVMYKMRKGVLRRAKKPTKTTGRVCQLLGKVDNRQARAISFSHIRTRRLQKVNLHWRRLYWEEAKCFVLLRLSTKGIKTITKYGLHQAAIKFGLDLTKHINGTSERKYIKYLPEKEKKLAMVRGARLRYKSAVRWAKLNDEEIPEPPKILVPSKGAKDTVEEPATIAMAISHGKKVPKLSKPADQRKALLRSLTTELIRHGRIKTTFIRAKAVRKHVDHMITLAKGGSLHERRQAIGYIYDKDLVKTLFEQVPDRYSARNGGYTRIIRTMPRKGDAAKMCYIELV